MTIVGPPVALGDRFSLSLLLVCDRCGRPLQPSWAADGDRVYVFLCGCQRVVVSAALVERLVRDRVEAESMALVANASAEALGPMFRSLFTAVRIGSDVEDLVFVWRI